jgi:catechol 2,3-dioxygenase-like lactoylglutathione lyase family enzyme
MLNVKLHHLSFSTDQRDQMIEFYRDQMGMTEIEEVGGDVVLRAKNRIMHFVDGPKNRLNYAAYGAPDQNVLDELRQKHETAGVTLSPSPSPVFGEDAYAITDPDGNQMVFGVYSEMADDQSMAGRMQHVVVASTQVEAMIAFYSDKVGFAVTDIVRKDDGVITSCFMRSNNEHHSFAVFLGETAKLDHNCYESSSWNDIRDWADHFSDSEITIIWGPGRHGPGNNLFIMVRDPDGNPVEISAEIEQVPEDRETGNWEHNPRTLNYWGKGMQRVE